MLGEDPNGEVIQKLEWLGLFRKKKIKLHNATPALILEHLIRDKWQLKETDKDMVIMHHEVEYLLEGKHFLHKSTMQLKGNNAQDTAMARTVGLPMGIFVRLVIEGAIKSRGVQIPVTPEVYLPVLKELEQYHIVFDETVTPLNAH